MLKVIEIYNIGFATQNIFSTVGELLLIMMLNKNEYIIKLFREIIENVKKL